MSNNEANRFVTDVEKLAVEKVKISNFPYRAGIWAPSLGHMEPSDQSRHEMPGIDPKEITRGVESWLESIHSWVLIRRVETQNLQEML